MYHVFDMSVSKHIFYKVKVKQLVDCKSKAVMFCNSRLLYTWKSIDELIERLSHAVGSPISLLYFYLFLFCAVSFDDECFLEPLLDKVTWRDWKSLQNGFEFGAHRLKFLGLRDPTKKYKLWLVNATKKEIWWWCRINNSNMHRNWISFLAVLN